MREPRPDTVVEAIDALGRPDVLFGPSPGQTTAGVVVGLVIAALGAAVAVWADATSTFNRVGAAAASVTGLGLAVWFWRLRRWRLAICPGGLVQVRGGAVDVLQWAEITEVVETRAEGSPGGPTVRVAVSGEDRTMRINPVNLRGRQRLFTTLLAEAGRRGIPVRVEWQQSD